MKKYKLGDTIYVKDTVTDIDCDDSAATYYGKHHGWLDNSCIIDELPSESVKPVLPKEVGDELEIAKKSNFSFDVYIVQIISGNATYYNSREFWFNSSDGVIKTLMDAWFNSYTVEEKKYNLVLGTDTDGDANALFKSNPCTNAALLLDTDTYADDLKLDKFYQFTQEEIDKYNKDFWIKNIDLNDYKVEVNDDDNED